MCRVIASNHLHRGLLRLDSVVNDLVSGELERVGPRFLIQWLPLNLSTA